MGADWDPECLKTEGLNQHQHGGSIITTISPSGLHNIYYIYILYPRPHSTHSGRHIHICREFCKLGVPYLGILTTSGLSDGPLSPEPPLYYMLYYIILYCGMLYCNIYHIHYTVLCSTLHAPSLVEAAVPLKPAAWILFSDPASHFPGCLTAKGLFRFGFRV